MIEFSEEELQELTKLIDESIMDIAHRSGQVASIITKLDRVRCILKERLDPND